MIKCCMNTYRKLYKAYQFTLKHLTLMQYEPTKVICDACKYNYLSRYEALSLYPVDGLYYYLTANVVSTMVHR